MSIHWKVINQPQACSPHELLEVLLGGKQELASRVMAECSSLEYLARPNFELTKIPGVGLATEARIRAAVELGKRSCSLPLNDRPIIQTPSDVAALYLYKMANLEQEILLVLLLNTRNVAIGEAEIYRGSMNSSLIRVGEIFKVAVRSNAASIVVLHNHPSGDPTPSPEDVAVTRAIVEAGKLLDIEVLDHIVIGKGQYVSLKARGLGFE